MAVNPQTMLSTAFGTAGKIFCDMRANDLTTTPKKFGKAAVLQTNTVPFNTGVTTTSIIIHQTELSSSDDATPTTLKTKFQPLHSSSTFCFRASDMALLGYGTYGSWNQDAKSTSPYDTAAVTDPSAVKTIGNSFWIAVTTPVAMLTDVGQQDLVVRSYSGPANDPRPTNKSGAKNLGTLRITYSEPQTDFLKIAISFPTITSLAQLNLNLYFTPQSILHRFENVDRAGNKLDFRRYFS